MVSGRQLEHYVFGSDTHLRDKQVAAKLRSMEFIPTTVVAEPKPPFPKAEEVAENLVRVTVDGELRWAEARPEEYVKRLLPFTRKSAGYYYAPKTAGGEPVYAKKTGERVMQRQHTRALHDMYLSLPPWISEVLADAMAYSDSIATVRRIAEQAAIAAAEVLEKRTGYKVVGIALHPDSRQAFGVHFQYLSVENNQLLGRSRGGTRGKRGVRQAGDVNCALHRFNKVIEIPGGWRDVVAQRDYDDIAMIDAMDQAIKEIVPAADSMKHSYVQNWIAKRSKSRGDLDREVDQLRKENEMLKEETKKLKSMLSMTTLKEKTAGEKRGIESILPPDSLE